MSESRDRLPIAEFIILLAMMMSIVALLMDIMLPALGNIGGDLGAASPNDVQLVASSLFLGFALGQVFAGPASDSFGQKTGDLCRLCAAFAKSEASALRLQRSSSDAA